MATIPTVPTFVAGDTSVTKLAQLAQAVSFLIDCDTRPAWHFYRTTTFALTASAWNVPGYTVVAYDGDNTQVSGGAVVQTQGYYACEGCVDIVNPTQVTVDLSFLVTFGANNPHHAPNSTLVFGQRGGVWATIGALSADDAITVGDICPAVLYPGDKVDLRTFVTIAETLNKNVNTAFNEGRFVANFTGYFLRTGS